MFSKEGVEISASSPEYGEAKEVIEKEFKGDTIAIGFNAQYVLDFLAAAADGPISFELKDEQSAGQLRPLGDETSVTATSSCPCASERATVTIYFAFHSFSRAIQPGGQFL